MMVLMVQKADELRMHPFVVDSSSYLIRLQSLPGLLDEDTLVDCANTTERVGQGRHLQSGFLSWNS